MNAFKLWLVVALTALFFAGGLQAKEVPKSLVVTLSSVSLESAGFGLAVADAMLDAGIPSTVFLAAEASTLANTQGYQPKFGGNATPRELIASVVKKGGKVFVCEGFVKMHNLDKSQMVQGVAIGTPGDLVGALYAPGAQSLTF